jgi:hypothetical protein
VFPRDLAASTAPLAPLATEAVIAGLPIFSIIIIAPPPLFPAPGRIGRREPVVIHESMTRVVGKNDI